MRDPAGTKHMPEQPHPSGRREQRANGPRALVSQPLHGSRPELAATTRAQHERPNTSSFHVLAPGGCGASGSPRPPIAAQTAPHASSAVTAGWVAGLLRVGRGRSHRPRNTSVTPVGRCKLVIPVLRGVRVGVTRGGVTPSPLKPSQNGCRVSYGSVPLLFACKLTYF